MFALLLIVFAAFGGLVLAALSAGGSFDALPGLPIAAAVIGALVLLYIATHAGGRGDRSFGRPSLILAFLGIAAAGATAFKAHPTEFIASLFASSRPDADVAPPAPSAPASVRIRRKSDGSFLVNGEINGEALPMRIDSGAATIVLRHSDAERAGVNIKGLTFDTALNSANGTSYLAAVRLKSVRVGPLVVDDVEGLVAQPGTLNESLLGMSFLRHLTSYQVTGDFATLRQ
jgi:aspartyl protease family protein